MTRASAVLILRVVATAHALAVLFQIAIMLLVYLEQITGATLHRRNAWLVLTLGLATSVAALIARWAINQALFRAIALITPAMEVMQLALGQSRGMIVHVALGLLIWAFSALVMFGAWSKPPRPPPAAREGT
jgi:hypothetical protein